MSGPFGPGVSGTCPCGGGTEGLAYAVCCGPLHAGDRPAGTADELMRSRYTAFVVGDEAYLLRTWHPRTRPERVGLDPQTRWTGLTVLRTERGGPDDVDGVVEFVARWAEPSAGTVGRGELHEVSRFGRWGGRWLYVDGEHG
ncbi:YchJ family protein [Terrabacter sp. LjRoot27]|uniref:YchJ family protein n=1 Tax=Terrabacter sp. LjRoot27 TaxID=3342306 RepID=UPI003F507C1B